jgi:hypothetical protein
MLKCVKNFTTNPLPVDITLICGIWNELLLLPFFIRYYKKLGVTHFIFIDNNSSDGTVEYLKNQNDLNLELYCCSDSYAKANFGITWVNEILNLKMRDKWCLVVDIDELLVFPSSESTVRDLASQLENQKTNVAQTCLIDFYPKRFDEVAYSTGTSFFDHSCYFHKFTEKTIYSKLAPDNSREIKGGLRHVILNGSKKPNSSSVCLTKKSFFKYDFYNTHNLSVGMHWILPKDFTCWWPPEIAYSNWTESNKHLKINQQHFILAHFKYLKPNIKQVFQERIHRNQDWNNSSEYKIYLNYLSESYYNEELTEKFTTFCDLYKHTVYTI